MQIRMKKCKYEVEQRKKRSCKSLKGAKQMVNDFAQWRDEIVGMDIDFSESTRNMNLLSIHINIGGQ